MKATWQLGEDADGPTLTVKLGNDHEMTVMFLKVGDPPQPVIELSQPSYGPWLLKGGRADAFRVWLAAAAKPCVMAD
jgi:hypothetical protein